VRYTSPRAQLREPPGPEPRDDRGHAGAQRIRQRRHGRDRGRRSRCARSHDPAARLFGGGRERLGLGPERHRQRVVDVPDRGAGGAAAGLLPPRRTARGRCAVHEGGFLNRSGRVESYRLRLPLAPRRRSRTRAVRCRSRRSRAEP
jgi:hypothetical protein